jgi:5-methylcytosine-specific restriction endonuclease McrA
MKYDWGKIRAAVLRRDRGVCVLCGLDTEKLTRVLLHVRRADRHEVAVALGFKCGQWRDWWEADHIHPRADGGGNELTNLRTLCIPCHKDVTRKFAAERAARRRRAMETRLIFEP